MHWRSSQSGPLLAQIIESLGHLQLTEEKLRSLFELGSLYQEKHRLIDWDWLLRTQPSQTYLRLHTEPRRYQLDCVDWQKRIHFQNEDFLIFNKPSQIPCHPMVDNVRENLLAGLEESLQQKLYLTHRLDIATEGLLLFAKTSRYQTLFNKALVERQVHKKYYARTCGVPCWKSGTELKHYMMPSPRAPKIVGLEPLPNYQECRLRILRCEEDLLTIELLTGRTHQIRAQLGFESHPIAGDVSYGAQSEPWGRDSIALQSFELQFATDATHKPWHFQLPLSEKLLRSPESKI